MSDQSRYPSRLLVCRDDWKRVPAHSDNNSPTIAEIISGNEALQLGIYECYRRFFATYGTHKDTYERVLDLFVKYLSNPLENTLSCASFTSREEASMLALSRACNTLRSKSSGDDQKRIEHTVLAYIIKRLEDRRFGGIPTVRICTGKKCKYVQHK